MALLEVIPVHLINSNSESFLVFFINSFFDYSMINRFVDIDSGCVAIVEYERVS